MYRRMSLWAFIAIIASTIIVNFVTTWTVVRLSERKWCELVSTLDAGYGEPVAGSPPLNERGKKIARDIHDLRIRRLHC
jgi:hypothetical protein